MDKLQVTQSDREAATDFADWHEGFKSPEEVYQLARAFAMRRISAEQRIVEWLRLMSDCLNSRTDPCGYCAGCGRRWAVDRIEAGDHREKEA